MAAFVLGLVLLALGSVSLWDAWRIYNTVRQPGAFDVLGPDGYLAAAGLLLAGIGAILAMHTFQARRTAAPIANDEKPTREFALTVALIGYAIALPLLGYVASTLLFAIAGFSTMDIRRWPVNGAASLTLVAVLHVLFSRVAGIVLPAGPWGI